MTRDRGYPDWLVLSARLLAQPSCGQVGGAKYMFDHVPLWLCEDITACCYMYCYFRNKVQGPFSASILPFSESNRGTHTHSTISWRQW